jgi:hypothetical protein
VVVTDLVHQIAALPRSSTTNMTDGVGLLWLDLSAGGESKKLQTPHKAVEFEGQDRVAVVTKIHDDETVWIVYTRACAFSILTLWCLRRYLLIFDKRMTSHNWWRQQT